MGRNEGWDRFIAVIFFVDVIVKLHGDPLLADFVGLQQAGARLIKIK